MQLTLIHVAERGRLREALEWMIRANLNDWADATLRQHREHAAWLLEWFGDCNLAAVTYERLCEYRDKEGPRGRGLMICSIIKRLNTLRMALKEAQRRGLIAQLPHWPKLVNDSKPGERICTIADFYKLLAVTDHPRQRLWLFLAYYTGMRRYDLNRVRWRHIDIRQRLFLRLAHKNEGRYPPSDFPMHTRLFAALEEAYERTAPAPTDWVAGPWTNVIRDLARLCLAAGIPRVTPNDLRRSCESNLRAAGANPEFVRLMMAHTQEVAEKFYIRPTPELLDAGAEAMRKVG